MQGNDPGQERVMSESSRTHAHHPLRPNRGDVSHDQQLQRAVQVINEHTQREFGPLPSGGVPVRPKLKPDLPRPARPVPETVAPQASRSINPALQARIDALQDADLRAHIQFILADPEPRYSTDEQIVEKMVVDHEEAIERRREQGPPPPSLWHPWSDGEVFSFIDHVRHVAPQDHAELVRLAHDKVEAGEPLSQRIRALGEQWRPGLKSLDYLFLFDKVQLHVRVDPDLLARVEALPHASLKAHILRILGRSLGHPITHEQIVDAMVRNHVDGIVKGATSYNWRKRDETEFVEILRTQAPEDYAGLLRQEVEDADIDDALLERVFARMEQWRPGLEGYDYSRFLWWVQGRIASDARRGG
jgi:hypothetical protein